MEEGIIALIGAGKGGVALLKVLLEIPGVKIKYVCDIDPKAEGVVFAKKNNIKYTSDYHEIIEDKEVSLIFESTGDFKLFKKLSKMNSSSVSLVGAGGSKIIYNLFDAYNEINRNLNEYKSNLEGKIIERTEELEKANADLENEVLKYEKISRKLQELNEEKSKYLLHATHQLKAPFSAIQSYADIILEGYAGEISQGTRDIILKIKERCELLSNVIKEMLELSRLKTGNEHSMLDKVNINEIINNVVKRYKITAKTKQVKIGINLDMSIVDEDLYIWGDKKQIDFLFSILIDNAISYSPPKSTVDIIIKKMGISQLYVGIKDEGIGIPEKNLDRIFNEFFRSNNAVDFNRNGTGLGLSIAKEIATIHNTTIQVGSKLNEGSCFSMVFRLI